MKLLSSIFAVLFATILIYSCKKNTTDDTPPAIASGTLVKTVSGDCAPISIGGVFIKNKALDSTNYMEVQVNFSVAGTYEITSDTLNGYSFKASGQVATTGTNTIKLKATGTPLAAGVNAFTIKFGNSTCHANVTVGTAAAIYTLGGTPGACTVAVPAGTYTNGVALTTANTVTIQVSVSVIGAYSITTDTVNGISFSSSGIFNTTGAQNIPLLGKGTPTAPGSFTFKIAGGCTFGITVLNAAGNLATLTTTAVSSISCTFAVSGGNITNNGGSAVTARGICISTTPAPTIAQGATNNGNGNGVFATTISGLTAGTTYYVRAYATNSAGTAYGNELSFTTTAGTCPVTIYVAGYEDIYDISGNIRTSKVWKNSTGSYSGTYIPAGGYTPEANGLFVSGTDVYVAGNEGGIAKVWKNNVPTSLTAAPTAPFFYIARANAVYVDGTDVYAAGQAPGSLAAYWKNGVTNLLSSGPYTAEAKAVFVSGGDVYVAGYENKMMGSPSTLIAVATLWKNGVAMPLTNGTANAEANAVFVAGSDVYIAGTEGTQARLWKNGVVMPLTSGSGNGTVANGVYVSGTDVYVAGTEHNGTSINDLAVVWKNGTPTYLTTAGYRNAAKSVFVVGADVYVAGTREGASANSVAIVWRNGFATPLTNGTTQASANGIFVK